MKKKIIFLKKGVASGTFLLLYIKKIYMQKRLTELI